jgi:hypothetical protein
MKNNTIQINADSRYLKVLPSPHRLPPTRDERLESGFGTGAPFQSDHRGRGFAAIRR